MNNLGVVAAETTPVQTVKKTSWMDTFNKVVNNVVQPAANVYTQIKTASGGGAVITPQPVSTGAGTQTYIPPPAPENNTTRNIIIAGVGVGALATIIYFATRKKKK
jgi:hypothetical protein